MALEEEIAELLHQMEQVNPLVLEMRTGLTRFRDVTTDAFVSAVLTDLNAYRGLILRLAREIDELRAA